MTSSNIILGSIIAWQDVFIQGWVFPSGIVCYVELSWIFVNVKAVIQRTLNTESIKPCNALNGIEKTHFTINAVVMVKSLNR